jgi:hypothetical protein
MTADRDRLLVELAGRYGDDPQAVGAADGDEDEFGDLCSDVYGQLGGDQDDDPTWQHFLDVATASRTTSWDPWLAELEAVITIYGRTQ